jgi:regulator of sigma E protease
MDAFSPIYAFVTGGFGYLIPFVIVLGVVVFVHESGHFWVGRWCGARIETFSIGFGRSIASWVDSKGTVWKIGWMPLGGYVKFWGDEDATSLPNAERLKRLAEDPGAADSFHFKPLWQKSLIVAAGPLANFVFAVLVYAVLYMSAGVTRVPPMLGAMEPGSAAVEAGLQDGDLVLAIDSNPITTFNQLQRAIVSSDGRPVLLTIERRTEVFDIQVQPKRVEREDRFGNKFAVFQLGVRLAENAPITYERLGPINAMTTGVQDVAFIIERTFSFLGRLIVGQEDARQLSGPIGIAKTSGEVATLGVLALIQLMAVLSVSVGLINLFPIPMLDGGHLLYYGIEAVRRRPLGERAQEYGLRMGLALVLSLMLFATWNDLMRIFWS